MGTTTETEDAEGDADSILRTFGYETNALARTANGRRCEIYFKQIEYSTAASTVNMQLVLGSLPSCNCLAKGRKPIWSHSADPK